VTSRKEELAENLAAVRRRIADACGAAGRPVDDVTLTVVTKFSPASDVHLLAALGVADVGESRHQEAAAKVGQCSGLGLRWHFIGNLQSNKASAVAEYADVVESVDRAKLVTGLSRGVRPGHLLDCLVQVNLDPDPGAAQGRGGVPPADAVRLAEQVRAAPGLRLRGVMAVAPLGQEPSAAFAKLARIAEQVRAVEPAATWLSAGMSADLEAAISCGATHVRIGGAVLGPRPPLG
jgi:PLP dependent protein